MYIYFTLIIILFFYVINFSDRKSTLIALPFVGIICSDATSDEQRKHFAKSAH